jgi:hypothetical protein
MTEISKEERLTAVGGLRTANFVPLRFEERAFALSLKRSDPPA